MTDQPLSPAAQAVLDATGTTGTPLELTARGIAAAALRAAADQLAYADSEGTQFIYAPELLAIATELET
jgi:hypothetical protein